MQDKLEYITTDRGLKNKIIGPINDERLSPDMKRCRSGRTQMFRRDYKDNQFIREDNADVILEPPEKHIYAELINGQWCWVNGCGPCNGEARDWVTTYIECLDHDICLLCRAPRDKFDGPVMGNKGGWICKPCYKIRHEKEKAEALAKMGHYNEWDYHGLNEIKCPYCDYEWSDSYEYHDADGKTLECGRCDNKFKVTAQHSLTFDCERISHRIG